MSTLKTQDRLSAILEALFPWGTAEVEMRTLSSDNQWITIRPRDGGLIEINRKNSGSPTVPAWEFVTIHMVPPMGIGGVDKSLAVVFANAVLEACKIAQYWEASNPQDYTTKSATAGIP